MSAVQGAVHIAVIVDIGEAIVPGESFAGFVIRPEGNGRLVKIAVLDGAIISVGIVSAGDQSPLAKAAADLCICSFISVVISLYAEIAIGNVRRSLGDQVDGASDGFSAIEGGGRSADDLDLTGSGRIHFQQGIVIVNARGADGDTVFQIEEDAGGGKGLPDAHLMLFIPQIDHEYPADLIEQLVELVSFGIGNRPGIDHTDGNGRFGPFLSGPVAGDNYLL